MRLAERLLLDEIAAQRAAFAEERAAWAEERKFLVNAAIASSPGEFALRQHATEERVVTQREPSEPRPQIIGM